MIVHNKQPNNEMFKLMQRLWPICRSITGDGVRETLSILREGLPNLTIHEVPTGTKCFDWVIPKEWSIRDAYILDSEGNKIVDFQKSNLHVVSYSVAINQEMELDELQPHLHSLPNQPNAIPYVTSYYKESWGFCLTHEIRQNLRKGRYRVVIDSELKDGSLTYGELILPGSSKSEVLLSTYVCHPSMANNELSGPCVTWELARWLAISPRKYTYRILFIPETIGSICYLSRNYKEMVQKTIAGFVLTCVGDERAWSLMPSINGDTLSDKIARHVLKFIAPEYTEYSFLQRGSDERQYCSPGINLPVASVMRSKYVTYPEYHTSLDNMEFVTPVGLAQSLIVYQRIIEAIEAECKPKYTVLCEPKMSERGLRSSMGKVGSALNSMVLMNLLMYSDGNRTLLDIADILNVPIWELSEPLELLLNYGLLSRT